jgi:hypothetical protein
MTTVKRVDIYWGDGSVTTDFSGNLVNITHEYDNNGEYYIIVAGCVDEIKLFTTNAIIVFDKI